MEISLMGKRIHIPKLVNNWLEFDRAFSAKVMAEDRSRMTKPELEYAALQTVSTIALAIALTACGRILSTQNKPIETPAVAKPQIAYYLKSQVQGDPTLQSQFAGVQRLSGKGDSCSPAIVMVEGGKAGGESAGFCTKDNVITNVVVRGDRNGTQQTVNEDLITRMHMGPDGKPDIAYIEYGSGDNKGLLFTYDYASKVTTWHFTSGGTVEFPAAQGPFEELIGKILEPGNVAVAAEIDTPTPTATVTATATLPATPTKDAPTPVPTTDTPQGNESYAVDGMQVTRQFVDEEWFWLNPQGEKVLSWDNQTELMVYSQTPEGTIIMRLDADLGHIQDVSHWDDESARKLVDDWGKATGVDVSNLKGLDLKVIAKDFDKTGKSLGKDYTEVLLKNGEYLYTTKPRIEGNYAVVEQYLPPGMREKTRLDWLLSIPRNNVAYLGEVIRESELGHVVSSADVNAVNSFPGSYTDNIDQLQVRGIKVGD